MYQDFLWPRKQVSQSAWHSALLPWQLWFLCTTVSSASDQDLSMPRSLGTDNPTGLPEQPRQGQLALKRLQIQAREVAKGGHAVIGYESEGVWIKQPLYPPDRVGQQNRHIFCYLTCQICKTRSTLPNEPQKTCHLKILKLPIQCSWHICHLFSELSNS